MTVNMRRLATSAADFEAEFQRLQHGSAETGAAIESRVAEIIADVRARGDAAVLELTARFDGVQAASMADLEIGADEYVTKPFSTGELAAPFTFPRKPFATPLRNASGHSGSASGFTSVSK